MSNSLPTVRNARGQKLYSNPSLWACYEFLFNIATKYGGNTFTLIC